MHLNPEDLLHKPAHTWHGVAVGWKKDLNASIKSLESVHDRIVGIKMSINDKNFLLISFYAPTSGHDDDFLESISYLYEFIKNNISAGDKVIIGADCNCSEKSSVRRQDSWRSFCDMAELEEKRPQYPTFHHHNHSSESFIDLFAVSPGLDCCQVTQHCTLETPLNLSSHDPIQVTICVEVDSLENKDRFSHTYKKFDREKVIWEPSKISAYQQMASSALSSAVSYWHLPETIPFLSSLISKLLVQCATAVFNCTSNSHKPPNQPSLKVRQAKNLLKDSFKRWKKAGKPSALENPFRIQYAQCRAQLQRIQRLEHSRKAIRQNHQLMFCNKNDRNKIYSMLKKSRGDYSDSTPSVLFTPVGKYHAEEVLEGFAADAEYLGKSSEDCSRFNRSFYNLCKLDNHFIFDFPAENERKIAPMTMEHLDHILQKQMKPGKACDIYHLTVEHLRHCGYNAKTSILVLINRILSNIYFLSCPELKLGLGTAVYKAKNKPASKSSSYRRITVSPILGAIIDYYLDPKAEAIFRPKQSPDQLGFTSGISYLLAAVQRGECQRWAIDHKLTCFGVSLDGEAAFPSVERDIQVRELFSIGERGDLLQYSRNTYRNTECHMKLRGKLSRKITEQKGNRQGHVRASGHFKVYINPALISLNSSELGFQLGPVCSTAECVADDCYLQSNSRSGLQASLDIISHYAANYQLKFNADKTKIVVTGSKADMTYYKETKPWTLNGERVSVVDNNEHLGLIVSGTDEEQKNIDQNISKCRGSMFSLLGPAYAYKCLLSPLVQHHLWKVYNLPVLLSGLSALPIKSSQTKSFSVFHNKVMRGILKLSNSSPIPALYFLLGDLPIEAVLHINTLTLFHNIWSNPDLTVHKIVKYALMMCQNNSSTWSNHIQQLCLKYSLPSPLSLLSTTAWPKSAWVCLVKSRVTNWHETYLRDKSLSNSKMKYLNVGLLGLSGAPHPALRNIYTSQDVKKLRIHLKLLTCDFLTNERLSLNQPHHSPACSLCLSPVDSLEHILTVCRATKDVRSRLLPELLNVVAKVQPACALLNCHTEPRVMTQFLLDCSSQNLPDNFRVPTHNPNITDIFKISRDWTFAVISERQRQLIDRQHTIRV